jgi:hypothetical protein
MTIPLFNIRGIFYLLMEEATYSIVLSPEELEYLRNALDDRIEEIPSSERILLLIDDFCAEGAHVTINKGTYDLINHLRFGGSECAKEWSRYVPPTPA